MKSLLLFVVSLLVLFSSLASFITAAEPLRVGFAENDITPPVGYRKAGGYREVVSSGIDAQLLAKAVVLEQGNVRCAIVLSDLTGVPEPLTTQARQAIAEQTGIPFDRLVIAATHNHGAPEYWGPLRDIWHDTAVARHGRDAVESADYPALLVDRWIDVVVQAQARAQRAELSLLVTQQPALAFNRRFHMRDGSVRFNPGKGNPDIVRPAGPVDIELPFLLARDETGRALGSLTVFAMHTATAGGGNFGPDFPGRLATNLRSTFGEPFISIFAEGTAGDVNHIDVRRTEKQPGNTEPARIGDTLAATITEGVEQLGWLQHPSLAIRSRIVRWPIKPGVREQDYRAAKQLIAEQKANRAAFLDLVAAWRDCHRWELQQRHGDKKPLEVQVVRLDTDTAIVTLPHEVFVELGVGIKSASPFRNTLVMTLANDVDFYIPTRRAFEEGSYEVTTCPLVPGCGEALVAAALEVLNELKEP